ncbi:hypothetical protein HGO97_012690 [Faecalicatena sp. AGMB00832]|uniref:Uncharacterized protein n=1 Tax=Faecalicatena faecalis TaxID=2726362 RepID=A0ABS6D4Y7_9FIRM|nr:hypothetical protein [Faecalicatena faecalis]MBU3876662.1 hypothetical protein [Faecalicatena faecalis]
MKCRRTWLPSGAPNRQQMRSKIFDAVFCKAAMGSPFIAKKCLTALAEALSVRVG